MNRKAIRGAIWIFYLSMHIISCSIIRIETQPESTTKSTSSCWSSSWNSQKNIELEGIWKADSSKCPSIGPYDEVYPQERFADDCHWGNYKIEFKRDSVSILGITDWTKNERIKWDGKGDWYVYRDSLFLCINWIKTYYSQGNAFFKEAVFQRDTFYQKYSCFDYRIYNRSRLTLTAQEKIVYFTNVSK
jgi:hypothetical protein